jgi:hypothetical protein
MEPAGSRAVPCLSGPGRLLKKASFRTKFPKSIPQGLKPPFDIASLIPGINPRPTARTTFFSKLLDDLGDPQFLLMTVQERRRQWLCSDSSLWSPVPTKHSQGTERIPPAWIAHRFTEWDGERLVERGIEDPSTVGLAAALDELQGFPSTRVGLMTGGPEVVERTEDVVVVAGRKRELEEGRICDLSG